MAFCDWLSQREGRTYRLQTSEEWYWAAKAGSNTEYYFGDEVAGFDDHAWHAKNSDWQAHPVARKKPNPWGLYDIYGNVWETCYIWKHQGRPVDPDHLREGPSPSDQTILLGGSYGDGVGPTLHTATNWGNMAYSHFGFRVILVGDGPTNTQGLSTKRSEQK